MASFDSISTPVALGVAPQAAPPKKKEAGPAPYANLSAADSLSLSAAPRADVDEFGTPVAKEKTSFFQSMAGKITAGAALLGTGLAIGYGVWHGKGGDEALTALDAAKKEIADLTEKVKTAAPEALEALQKKLTAAEEKVAILEGSGKPVDNATRVVQEVNNIASEQSLSTLASTTYSVLSEEQRKLVELFGIKLNSPYSVQKRNALLSGIDTLSTTGVDASVSTLREGLKSKAKVVNDLLADPNFKAAKKAYDTQIANKLDTEIQEYQDALTALKAAETAKNRAVALHEDVTTANTKWQSALTDFSTKETALATKMATLPNTAEVKTTSAAWQGYSEKLNTAITELRIANAQAGEHGHI